MDFLNEALLFINMQMYINGLVQECSNSTGVTAVLN